MNAVAQKHLTVQSGNALICLPLESIRYLESRRHYLIVHARCGTFRIRGRISEYAERLACAGFVRTHRCYLVRIASEIKIRTADVELADGTRIPVGRRYREMVLQVTS